MDRIQWLTVVLGIPNFDQPSKGNVYRIGQILVDALTGEVQDTETLIEESC